jgi:hypothetical protein
VKVTKRVLLAVYHIGESYENNYFGSLHHWGKLQKELFLLFTTTGKVTKIIILVVYHGGENHKNKLSK